MRFLSSFYPRLSGFLKVAAAGMACAVFAGGAQPLVASAGSDPSVQMLAIQRVASVFPEGTAPSAICLFINQVHQSPGAQLLHRHQAGAVYAVGGDVELTIWQDGLAATDPGAESTTTILARGDGAIIPTHWWHQHSNRGTTVNTWYFLSALHGSGCSTPPASFRYVSQTVAFSDGPRLLKLFTTTFAAGDESAQAGPGMIESLVLRGTLQVGGRTYAAGQGFYHSPGSVLHIASPDGAQLLSYSMAPAGR